MSSYQKIMIKWFHGKFKVLNIVATYSSIDHEVLLIKSGIWDIIVRDRLADT